MFGLVNLKNLTGSHITTTKKAAALADLFDRIDEEQAELVTRSCEDIF